MGGVLTFLFLVFGWIWLSSSLTIENVEVKKSNQTYEVQKSKKDRVTEHLLDRALEKRLKEKLFWGREKSEETINLYRRKIAKILGSEDREPWLYSGDEKSEELILMFAMSDYGKVPYMRLMDRTDSSFFTYFFCPHLSDDELVKLLRWYENNLHDNGGYDADIMAFAGASGIGAIYFDGTIIPPPPQGKRLC